MTETYTNPEPLKWDEPMTVERQIKFNILVPFWMEMEKKRQREVGKLTKQSAHEIYNKATTQINALIAKARIDELEKLSARSQFHRGWRVVKNGDVLERIAQLQQLLQKGESNE